jgi:hypothetical protein
MDHTDHAYFEACPNLLATSIAIFLVTLVVNLPVTALSTFLETLVAPSSRYPVLDFLSKKTSLVLVLPETFLGVLLATLVVFLSTEKRD